MVVEIWSHILLLHKAASLALEENCLPILTQAQASRGPYTGNVGKFPVLY